MTGRLPAFIIGGAPRSGTTWLARALDRHPDIWLARPLRPEPKFFLVDDLYAGGLPSYSARWFDPAPPVPVLGEKSTNYLESPAAARRIGADLPHVKMIFALRDPADRAVSNYRFSVMNGLEDVDLATALALEEQRDATVAPERKYARPHAYFSRGCYARLLRPYFEHLPAEQLLCVRFEDMIGDASETIAGIHSFLGVKPRPDLVGDLPVINASAADIEIPADTVAQLRRAYAPRNDELGSMLGSSFRLWDAEEART